MSRRQLALVALGLAALVAGGFGLRGCRHRHAPGRADGGAGRFTLAGRVIDRLGRAIGGAKVSAQAERGEQAWLSTTSDGEGRYRLERGSAAAVRVRAEAEGYVTEELRAVEPPQAGLELALARRLALDGLARSRGKPAPDVEITVGGPGGARTVKSGPDGAFTVANLAEGRYAVRAVGDGQGAFADGVMVTVGDGGSGVVTLDLQPATTVTARLRDRDGKPIAGGDVTLAEADGTPLPRTATSDADGAVRFAGVLPGRYLVDARAESYYPAAPHPLTVARTPAALELRLERGAVVSGRVLDERAQPVAGAQVEISGEAPDGTPIAVTASSGLPDATAMPANGRFEASGELGVLRGPIPYPPAAPATVVDTPVAPTAVLAQKMFVTDADGRFRIAGLPAGRLVVVALHPEYARGASEPLRVPAGGDAAVTVVLSRGVRVEGRVTDDRGDPIGGAEVVGDDGAEAVTDRRGQWELSHVARVVTVTARAPGYLPASRPVAPSERGPFDLVLRRAEGHLAGDVVDDRGAPVSAARVEITAPPLPARWFTTDRDGRFRADGLGNGPYHVTVTHGDFAVATVPQATPGDDFHVQLSPGGGVDGDLRDARTGAVPPGAHVEIAVGGAKPRALSIVGGRFSATALPAGKAVLSAGAPGYVPWSRPLDVAASDRLHEVTARDVRIELERGGTVRGRVRDDRGDPVADAPVTVAGSAGRTSGRSDRDGEFHIDGVAAGRARVSVEHQGASASEDVDVRAGDESHVELRLR